MARGTYGSPWPTSLVFLVLEVRPTGENMADDPESLDLLEPGSPGTDVYLVECSHRLGDRCHISIGQQAFGVGRVSALFIIFVGHQISTPFRGVSRSSVLS